MTGTVDEHEVHKGTQFSQQSGDRVLVKLFEPKLDSGKVPLGDNGNDQTLL